MKNAHSEVALFALYWLVVAFPCEIVHILVMIGSRVVHGGRRVGQVLPSYQNRQISALDEMADAPQSSLFSLLSSLFCICLSISVCLSVCLVGWLVGWFRWVGWVGWFGWFGCFGCFGWCGWLCWLCWLCWFVG